MGSDIMNKEEVKNILISIRTPENEKLVNYLLGEIDIMDEASIEQATAKLGNNKESVKDFFTKKNILLMICLPME